LDQLQQRRKRPSPALRIRTEVSQQLIVVVKLVRPDHSSAPRARQHPASLPLLHIVELPDHLVALGQAKVIIRELRKPTRLQAEGDHRLAGNGVTS